MNEDELTDERAKVCPRCGALFTNPAKMGQITCDQGCTWRACMMPCTCGKCPPMVVFSLIPIETEIQELMTR